MRFFYCKPSSKNNVTTPRIMVITHLSLKIMVTTHRFLMLFTAVLTPFGKAKSLLGGNDFHKVGNFFAQCYLFFKPPVKKSRLIL